MILKGQIKAYVNKVIQKEKSDFDEKLKKMKNDYIAKMEQIRKTQNKIMDSIKDNSKKISQLTSDIASLQESLKNVNGQTIKRLESLVAELKEKTKDMQKTNAEIEKIKKIFQDSIKTNIELAKEFDGLKKRIKTVEIKLNGVLSVKKDAPVLAGKNNIKRMDFLSKKDYINSFGFYYAGYSEDGNVPTGYISDSTGKIYEVKIGDVINDRYKVSEIKPLYLKLKDVVNGKEYIISYKQ